MFSEEVLSITLTVSRLLLAVKVTGVVILDPVRVLVLRVGHVVQHVVGLVVVMVVTVLLVVGLDVRNLDLELGTLDRTVKMHVGSSHVVVVIEVVVTRLFVDYSTLGLVKHHHDHAQRASQCLWEIIVIENVVWFC